MSYTKYRRRVSASARASWQSRAREDYNSSCVIYDFTGNGFNLNFSSAYLPTSGTYATGNACFSGPVGAQIIGDPYRVNPFDVPSLLNTAETSGFFVEFSSGSTTLAFEVSNGSMSDLIGFFVRDSSAYVKTIVDGVQTDYEITGLYDAISAYFDLSYGGVFPPLSVSFTSISSGTITVKAIFNNQSFTVSGVSVPDSVSSLSRLAIFSENGAISVFQGQDSEPLYAERYSDLESSNFNYGFSGAEELGNIIRTYSFYNEESPVPSSSFDTSPAANYVDVKCSDYISLYDYSDFHEPSSGDVEVESSSISLFSDSVYADIVVDGACEEYFIAYEDWFNEIVGDGVDAEVEKIGGTSFAESSFGMTDFSDYEFDILIFLKSRFRFPDINALTAQVETTLDSSDSFRILSSTEPSIVISAEGESSMSLSDGDIVLYLMKDGVLESTFIASSSSEGAPSFSVIASSAMAILSALEYSESFDVIVLSGLSMEDSSSYSYNGSATAHSAFRFRSSSVFEVDMYKSYCVNKNTGAASRYDGFFFDSFAKSGGKVYGIRKNGVYEIGGSSDSDIPIKSSISTGMVRFSGEGQKRLQSAYVSGEVSGESSICVVSDKDDAWKYRMDSDGRYKNTRVKLGRGLSAYAYRFEIENEGNINIDSMHVDALYKSRRV